ncbi:MAG: ribonuclease P protein component [Bacteroidota bacterium]
MCRFIHHIFCKPLKKKNGFQKKKIIRDLFDKGNEFFIPPVRVLWNAFSSEQTFTVKILTAVSNKNFKKAVDRNRIKRLLREAYRKNKQILYDALHNRPENLMIVLQYTGKTILTYKETEAKIILILQRLLIKHDENSG